jgi:surfeit locus 1 family protein
MERNPSTNGARGYRFTLRPKWLLSHLLVLGLVVLMVNLGFWQLRRLDQRQEANDRIRANAGAEPAELVELVAASRAEDVEWRPVIVEGAYRVDDDVLVANRTLEGQPGFWIVTPLEPRDGSPALAVVRGFVTRTLVSEGRIAEAAAPEGTVRVTGFVQTSRSGGRFAKGSGDGGLPEISRVDLAELAERWGELAPLWIQLDEQEPSVTGGTLTPVPLPELDEGPHLSYAVQWFIFSAIAVVGYPLVLRRNARGHDDDGE